VNALFREVPIAIVLWAACQLPGNFTCGSILTHKTKGLVASFSWHLGRGPNPRL